MARRSLFVAIARDWSRRFCPRPRMRRRAGFTVLALAASTEPVALAWTTAIDVGQPAVPRRRAVRGASPWAETRLPAHAPAAPRWRRIDDDDTPADGTWCYYSQIDGLAPDDGRRHARPPSTRRLRTRRRRGPLQRALPTHPPARSPSRARRHDAGSPSARTRCSSAPVTPATTGRRHRAPGTRRLLPTAPTDSATSSRRRGTRHRREHRHRRQHRRRPARS